MEDHALVNNRVTICGTVSSPLEFSHQLYGEGFYICYLRVKRLSDYYDILPVTLSERLLGDNIYGLEDVDVTITGQMRSYNKYIDGNNRLVLTIFARSLVVGRETDITNEVFLEGYLCKPPIYRTTPFNREITDMLLAVNRGYNKSDYIPCIAWSRNARFAGTLDVGDRLRVSGRMQSREYEKVISEDNTVRRTAYEVSISRMELPGINYDK